MQTWLDVLFVVALVLPPAVVAGTIVTALATSVYWRSHGTGSGRERIAMAVDHPVGR